MVEEGYFESVQYLFIVVLALGRTEYSAVRNAVNEMLEYIFGFWWQEYIALLIIDQNDELAIDLMEVFVGVDVLTGQT